MFESTAGVNKGLKHLRLMATPLLEYSAPEQGVETGAVFAFTPGTNPDVLLMVQLEKDESGTLKWTYAPVRLTSDSCRFFVGKDLLWEEEGKPTSGYHGRWGYFFTRRDPNLVSAVQ